MGMFVRKLTHKNGISYIQVVDKSSGRYQVLKSFGGSRDPKVIDQLYRNAREWIRKKQGIMELDFTSEKELVQNYLDRIEQLRLVGLELLLGRLFDQIGFNQIDDPIFKQLVLYRIAFPKSKLKTTEYLYRYQGLSWGEDQLYRYLDKLYYHQKSQVERISFTHSRRILGGQITIVFYDVTTLHFAIDREDEWRKTGFSKEGKHQRPQLVLGLLVSEGGYPLAYDVFPGNTFEGHTLLGVLERFKKTYKLEQLVIVADAGMLSNANLEQLEAKGYEFIVGARVKNESNPIKKKIQALSLRDGQYQIIGKDDYRLIVTYSRQRAAKDAHNRRKGLKRLEKQIKSGRLTKSSINNRGYNKYLKLTGEVNVEIDYEKFERDAKWDGLKGYVTNSGMDKEQLVANYKELWQIEKAFKVSKSELKIRPIYHRLPRRIHAHICISFVAYKVYKELERCLKQKKASISAQKAIEIAENIFEITIQSPITKEKISKTLLLTDEQKYLAELFEFGC